MRVAIVTQFFYPVKGGVENHCFSLAKKLFEKGIDVEVHTSTDTLTEKNVLKEYELINDIKVFRHRKFWRFVPSNYDIVHLHNFNVFPHAVIFLSVLIRRILRKVLKSVNAPKLIITPHGGYTPWWDEFSYVKKLFKKCYHKTIGKLFLNYVVDVIIAVNEWEREKLIEEGIEKNKIIIVPNGVEDLAYELPFQKERDLEKYKPYILFLGRISKIKNLDFVIKCLKNVKNINLMIVGPFHEPEYYNVLIGLAEKQKVKERIIFYGEAYGKEKYRLIDNTLALILLSHNETDPIVLKEAMARGKPVIVSNSSVLPYIVKNLENGFIVANEEQFIDAINNLVNNKELVKKIEKNNKNKSLEWRWQNIVDKVLEAYGVTK